MQPLTRHLTLDHLAALVGEWETEATHQALPGTVIHGRATFEWLEGCSFLIWRAHYDHPDIPDCIAILGCDDEGDLRNPGGAARCTTLTSAESRVCITSARRPACGGSGGMRPVSRSASRARSAQTAGQSTASWSSVATAARGSRISASATSGSSKGRSFPSVDTSLRPENTAGAYGMRPFSRRVANVSSSAKQVCKSLTGHSYGLS
jgi:hypothetical protein